MVTDIEENVHHLKALQSSNNILLVHMSCGCVVFAANSIDIAIFTIIVIFTIDISIDHSLTFSISPITTNEDY